MILFAEGYDDRPFRPASRPSNPGSSHEAEERITKSGLREKQCDLVLDLIRRFHRVPEPIFRTDPDLGFTVGELAHLAMRWTSKYGALGETESEVRHTLGRRLPDLRVAGHVENHHPGGGKSVTKQCAVTGRQMQVWWRR